MLQNLEHFLTSFILRFAVVFVTAFESGHVDADPGHHATHGALADAPKGYRTRGRNQSGSPLFFFNLVTSTYLSTHRVLGSHALASLRNLFHLEFPVGRHADAALLGAGGRGRYVAAADT